MDKAVTESECFSVDQGAVLKTVYLRGLKVRSLVARWVQCLVHTNIHEALSLGSTVICREISFPKTNKQTKNSAT